VGQLPKVTKSHQQPHLCMRIVTCYYAQIAGKSSLIVGHWFNSCKQWIFFRKLM